MYMYTHCIQLHVHVQTHAGVMHIYTCTHCIQLHVHVQAHAGVMYVHTCTYTCTGVITAAAREVKQTNRSPSSTC